MTKLANWQHRLNQYLYDCSSKHFKYGVYDCGQFVIGSIYVQTGIQIEFPLDYNNRKEGFSAIKSLCGHATCNSIGSYFAEQLGLVEGTDINFIGRGDVVLLDNGSFGIVDLNGAIVTPAKMGIAHINKDRVTKYWKVS
jgi:hypothetical protein